MKNIFILPTNQPSKLYKNIDREIGLTNIVFRQEDGFSQNQHIYITSSEEIKEGVNQWYLDLFLNKPYQSGGAQYQAKQEVIILTTDPTLIADGVQAIDDEFLEWFVKNPTCEFVEVDKIPNLQSYNEKTHKCELVYTIAIPQEEPKQDFAEEWKELEDAKLCEPLKSWNDDKQSTLEEAAEKYSQGWGENDDVKSFIAGGKHVAERMYSEEDLREAFSYYYADEDNMKLDYDFKEWFEQFKKK